MPAPIASCMSAEHPTHPTPVRLRPATETAIGTTAFFRNRPLIKTLLDRLASSGKDHYRVLFHASSIGTEVYSLLISYLSGGYDQHFDLRCLATDKEEGFIEFAAQGLFPSGVMAGMTSDESRFFNQEGSSLRVSPEISERVTFLPASDFTEYSSKQSFDVVILLNALLYVPAETQPAVIDRISSYNNDILAITGFHPERIKDDLVRNQYRPITHNIEAIHEGWTDRRVAMPAVPEQRAGIYAEWRLPPFSKIPDYQYRYGSLFTKQPT